MNWNSDNLPKPGDEVHNPFLAGDCALTRRLFVKKVFPSIESVSLSHKRQGNLIREIDGKVRLFPWSGFPAKNKQKATE